ncbi:hypothetical protein QYZ88_016140 [Lachnospiraceae bacterium C1.1]|nr:hypothetical protein [Lachnospiraceae bacterium C1.1]
MAEDNKKYKDRLFNFIFGAEENKEWTLSLYNAVNGSDYRNFEEIEITTIKEVMYLGMHNDVSFLMKDEMNLYEQQSSFNPDMPLRMLQYIGNLYEKYVTAHKLNKYGSELLELPVPKLVVFYNGSKNTEDELYLKLSSSFPQGAESDIEVRVRMINVNYGKNPELLEKCKPLGEYAWLVDRIRKIQSDRNAGNPIESAIDRAIKEIPEDFVLRPFLMVHRSEVKGMLLTEYNEDETMQLFREDGRREGRQEGLKEGLKVGRQEGLREGRKEGLAMICTFLKNGGTEETAKTMLNVTDAQIEEAKKLMKSEKK